jgi:hypothetical protein
MFDVVCERAKRAKAGMDVGQSRGTDANHERSLAQRVANGGKQPVKSLLIVKWYEPVA